MAKPQNIKTTPHPKTLIIGIQAPYNKTKNIEAHYEEFRNLLKTSGVEYDEERYIKLRNINPKTFITPGKLEEIDKICKQVTPEQVTPEKTTPEQVTPEKTTPEQVTPEQVTPKQVHPEQKRIEEIYLSEPITSRQSRNLENYLNCSVFDRTDLILDIFLKSAHTAEGKMQVEIASLEHEKTRLTGKGIHLAQQRGGIGVKGGAGETLKEKELRYINSHIKGLKKRLEQLQVTRETQRKRRMATGVPQICLIGYTNAGKSTILNTLTKAGVLAEDKLFATLDTTTRELYVNKQKVGILSDTVGFIQYLPHKLVEAFKSTLSELQYADLLLEVIDASDTDWQAHVNVVQNILDELEVEKPIVYVFNKIDKLTDEQRDKLDTLISPYKPHVLISATNKDVIKPLIDFLDDWHNKQ